MRDRQYDRADNIMVADVLIIDSEVETLSGVVYGQEQGFVPHGSLSRAIHRLRFVLLVTQGYLNEWVLLTKGVVVLF